MTSEPTRATGPDRGRKVVIARADAIPEGGRLIVDVEGRSIGVFHVRGAYYALLNRCPHQAGPLCQGALVHAITATAPGRLRLDGDGLPLLECPWHGWEFDLRTGQSYLDPVRTRVRPYPVEVEPGSTVAARGQEAHRDDRPARRPGPRRAETIPIAVEDDYLVLTVGR